MEQITAKTPWADHLGDVPLHLEYFEGSMFEALENIARQYPDNIAFDFMGKSTSYRRLIEETERCAKALKTIGVREMTASRLPCRTALRQFICFMP